MSKPDQISLQAEEINQVYNLLCSRIVKEFGKLPLNLEPLKMTVQIFTDSGVLEDLNTMSLETLSKYDNAITYLLYSDLTKKLDIAPNDRFTASDRSYAITVSEKIIKLLNKIQKNQPTFDLEEEILKEVLLAIAKRADLRAGLILSLEELITYWSNYIFTNQSGRLNYESTEFYKAVSSIDLNKPFQIFLVQD